MLTLEHFKFQQEKKMTKKLGVLYVTDMQGNHIATVSSKADYISLTDIARYKRGSSPADIIKNWLRTKNTIEFLGFWETLHNPDFQVTEFDLFKSEAGTNYFVLSPQKWIATTHAIGMISKSGKNGGTFAHQDIAFEFASWISPQFKLYLIKEFQRFKENEDRQLGWDLRRNLSKINYRIHTNAIQQNLIPTQLTKKQTNSVYASEADMLNTALFGMTAKEWREANPNKPGNIRDYANVAQLVCLSNLENLNAHFINDGLPQSERLTKLNQIAIQQMQILANSDTVKKIQKSKVLSITKE